MGRWVQRDAQTWWAIIQRQMESGLSQVAFCAAEGLSVSSLQNWKRKFVREGRIAQASAAVSAPWFAELAVPEAGGGNPGTPTLLVSVRRSHDELRELRDTHVA